MVLILLPLSPYTTFINSLFSYKNNKTQIFYLSGKFDFFRLFKYI